jgi:hypothetical protein
MLSTELPSDASAHTLIDTLSNAPHVLTNLLVSISVHT